MHCAWGLWMDIFILYYVFIYLCVIFGCAVSSLLHGLFPSRSERGLLSSCSAWASHYHGFSCCKAQTLNTGSIVMVHRFRCSAACGIFLDQGSNPCLLHWQVDSLPPSHQGNLQMGIYSHESNLLSLLLIQGKTHSSFGAISFLKLSIQKCQIPENSRGEKFCFLLAASRLIPFSEELHGIKQTGNVRLLSNPLSSSPSSESKHYTSARAWQPATLSAWWETHRLRYQNTWVVPALPLISCVSWVSQPPSVWLKFLACKMGSGVKGSERMMYVKSPC